MTDYDKKLVAACVINHNVECHKTPMHISKIRLTDDVLKQILDLLNIDECYVTKCSINIRCDKSKKPKSKKDVATVKDDE
jgi:hypothetical protein